MGNYCCVIHSSSAVAVWDDDDNEWGAINESMEREGLLVGYGDSSSSSSSSTMRTTGDQVRIRISKKELEEVLRKIDHDQSGTHQMKVLKGHHVLQKLIDKSDHFEIHHYHHDQDQRSWTPALQSIPEVN